MKLLEQLLCEYGADLKGAVTLIPDFGGYFANVKKVIEFSSEKIVLTAGKKCISICGENLAIGKYFQADLLIRGSISGVTIE